jgi:hypothetical protein
MPTDPNARRDQALKSIADSLKSIDGTLAKIEKNTRPAPVSYSTYIDQQGVGVPPPSAVEQHEGSDD